MKDGQMERWARPLEKYRKAIAGEIKCCECRHYKKSFQDVRGRCGDYPAVGKNHTCDAASSLKGSL